MCEISWPHKKVDVEKCVIVFQQLITCIRSRPKNNTSGQVLRFLEEICVPTASSRNESSQVLPFFF